MTDKFNKSAKCHFTTNRVVPVIVKVLTVQTV